MRPIQTLAPALLAAPVAAQFASPQPLGQTANTPTAVAILDVDRDGDEDIVTTASLQGRLVWLERLGPGDFAPPATLVPDLVEPTFLDSGDVDGDGDMDLLVGTPDGNTMLVVDNIGASTFVARAPLPSAEPFLLSVELADADADGDLDAYAVSQQGMARGSVLLYRNDGTGVFSAPLEVLPSTVTSVLYAVVEDVDRDGAADVIVRRFPIQNSLVHMRNTGNGTLAAPVTLQGGVNDRPIAVGDVDGDGDLDLVSSSNARVTVRLLDASGDFGGPSPLPGSTGRADRLLVEDLDGDGDDDVLATLGPQPRAKLFESLGTAGFAPEAVIATNAAWQFADAATSDVDGDGVLDVVTTTAGADQAIAPGLITYIRGRGLAQQPAFASPRVLVRTLVRPSGVVAADFDGDGAVDVLTRADNEFRLALFESIGGAGFERFVALESPPYRAGPTVARDFDGDGRPDLVEQALQDLTIRRNLGGFQFGPRTTIESDMGVASRAAAADLDGDGDLDLAATAQTKGLVWYENLGGFQWGPRQSIDLAARRITMPPVAEDLDGDGFVDLVADGPSGGSLAIFWYRGTATGFAPGQVIAVISEGFGALLSHDIDGDGLSDLVWSNPSSSSVWWVRNLGGGAFGQETVLALAPNGAFRLQLVDVDGDGDDDLVRLTGALTLSWSERVGATAFSATPTDIVDDVASYALVDIDGDFDEDIVAAQRVLNEVVLVENVSLGSIGTSYCGPAVPNSSGRSGTIDALGSPLAADDAITLRARDMATDAFGFFLNSRTQGVTFPVVNSVGRLCLTGNVGRHSAPDEVRFSGADGAFSLRLDLAAIPTPTGFVAATAGETWNFQAWHRDVAGGALTSNFTDAVSVTLQ